MVKLLKKLRIYFRFALIYPGIRWDNEKLNQDIDRWKSIRHMQGDRVHVLAELLFMLPEFRNLYLYRVGKQPIHKRWVSLWYPPMNTLFITTGEIGGGLFIQHGFSTMISAKTIGENCWINQQVTLGYKDLNDPPIIEDNVSVGCGAKVLGNITVGHHSVIGANAVIVKDVEPYSIMGGVPAKKIGTNSNV